MNQFYMDPKTFKLYQDHSKGRLFIYFHPLKKHYVLSSAYSVFNLCPIFCYLPFRINNYNLRLERS